jgi:allantoicase
LAKAVTSIDALTHPLQPSLVPIHPETITPENFSPFGQIIQAFPDPSTRKTGMIVQGNPAAKVEKYCRLADVVNTYPKAEGAYTGIGVYRATKKVGLERGQTFDVRLMERHSFTSQAFIPMSKGEVSTSMS